LCIESIPCQKVIENIEMIKVENLRKLYGGKAALNVEELTINESDCIGLVGNNGAGKTTLLSLILDLIKASEGAASSKGVAVNKSYEWKKYTGAYLDESFLIPHLSPMEYMEFIGSLHGIGSDETRIFITECSDFFEHELFFRKRFIRDLSTGNKNKVGILSALISSPELLILDEPFASLDPTSQGWLKKTLIQYKEKGTTMILSSHDLNHVTDVSNRVVLLEEGQVIKDLATTSDTLSELENYFMVE